MNIVKMVKIDTMVILKNDKNCQYSEHYENDKYNGNNIENGDNDEQW